MKKTMIDTHRPDIEPKSQESALPPEDEAGTTRLRLLDAAVELFAEQGYRRTTVREIVDAAGANIAAVNYHFGGKEKLYHEAMDHARRRSNESNELVRADHGRDFNAGQPPERRLYLFVRTMLGHIFRDGRPTLMTKLMQQELMQPTPALDRLVEQSVARVHGALVDIVQSLMPAGTDRSQARRAAMSVMGQVHSYHLLLPLIERLNPEQGFEAQDLDAIAEHITRFSLAALRSTGERPPC